MRTGIETAFASQQRAEWASVSPDEKEHLSKIFCDEWEKRKLDHGQCCDLTAMARLKLEIGIPINSSLTNAKRFYCTHGTKLEDLIAGGKP